KEVSVATVAEIQKEMDALKRGELSNEELEAVKNYMVGSYLNSINSSFAVMDKIKTLHFHQLPMGFYENFYEAVKTVGVEDIVETANRFFIPENSLLVTAG